MRICGIDVGLNGAVAVVDTATSPFTVELHDMPVLQESGSRRRDYDVHALVRLLRRLELTSVFVERQQARPENPRTTFLVGYGYGVVLGVLGALGLPHQAVWPQTWQAAMFRGTDGATKNRSLLVARRLFPHVELRRHDEADALLLAEYGRRLFYGREGVW